MFHALCLVPWVLDIGHLKTLSLESEWFLTIDYLTWIHHYHK
jgi:hypothetical protein